MKFLKPKRQPQPANRFQKYLQSQPVFNWFERYEQPATVNTEYQDPQHANWIAKRVGE
ncbi:hypothetical protein HHX48_00415 [Salinimonas sp. HHU 13199]|uniref:Uncharacterized protein n=1 Tax=Salinimonas profundi TaxID=2729140 RepID=A0ABR8LJC6_9ALTE|nr:hypothetical protein [Salinimonas profundi]MBD3584195.1 hypothetical protein [Salinimonas profundi]